MEVNYDEETTENTPGTSLSRLRDLCDQYRAKEREIAHADKELKRLKKELEQISGEDIPSFMDESGLSETRLDDGTKVVVERQIVVSTTGKYRPKINAWVEEIGHGDLIKNEFTIAFGKDETERANEFKKAASQFSNTVNQKQYVHAATFKSLVSDLLKEGEEIPMDEIGVHEFRRTKLEQ